MKGLVHILFLLLCSTAVVASDITAVGKATQVINGRDTLLFFKDEVHLKTDTLVDWFSADGTAVSSNTDEIFPDEGGYYFVKKNTYQSAPIYAFLYSEPDTCTLTVVPDCEATTLTLKGDTKPIVYTRTDGTTGNYARACSIDYTALSWNSETWGDSAVHMTNTLHEGNYVLPALYGPTPIRLTYDPAIRAALGLDSAYFETELTADEVRAVTMEMTSLATTRGAEGEKSNERNRPTSQKLVQGSEYSGELEVAFYSNPTPAVTFYYWAIYHGADRIATRQDKDIRYTFSQPGSYRVVCRVNNQYCSADSVEMTVNISESYLAVPNVFTPNGDGVNDEFRVAYRSLREFHGWVYNRWGKLVFEWTDPAKGWDGTIGGRPAAEGAYFYVIRALGTDAAKDAKYIGLKASYQKKKVNADEAVIGIYQMSGDINLLRGKRN